MSLMRNQLVGMSALMVLATVLALSYLGWTDRLAAQQSKEDSREKAEKTSPKSKVDIPAADLALMKALDSYLAIDFKATPLKKVLEDLEGRSGGALSFVIDDVGLQKAKKDTAAFLADPVTRSIKRITIRRFLRQLLQERGAGYHIEDGNLTITTKEQADKKLTIKNYPASNLVGGPRLVQASYDEYQSLNNGNQGQPIIGPLGKLLGGNIDGLVNQIVAVDPEHWPPGAGLGDIKYMPASGDLQVRASLEVHYLLMVSGVLDNKRAEAEKDLKKVIVKVHNIAGLLDLKKAERGQAELSKAINLLLPATQLPRSDLPPGFPGADKVPSAEAYLVFLTDAELLVVRQSVENQRKIEILLAEMKVVRGPYAPKLGQERHHRKASPPGMGGMGGMGMGGIGGPGPAGLFGMHGSGVFGDIQSVPPSGGGVLGIPKGPDPSGVDLDKKQK